MKGDDFLKIPTVRLGIYVGSCVLVWLVIWAAIISGGTWLVVTILRAMGVLG